MLRVLNYELAADFDPDGFDHRAFYDRDSHRIEMHLVAHTAHWVAIPGLGDVRFAAGESIRTEISCKHDLPSLAELFSAAGLRLDGWQSDARRRFVLAVGAPV
jgi:L-histidine N-alpha-methyltransferase